MAVGSCFWSFLILLIAILVLYVYFAAQAALAVLIINEFKNIKNSKVPVIPLWKLIWRWFFGGFSFAKMTIKMITAQNCGIYRAHQLSGFRMVARPNVVKIMANSKKEKGKRQKENAAKEDTKARYSRIGVIKPWKLTSVYC